MVKVGKQFKWVRVNSDLLNIFIEGLMQLITTRKVAHDHMIINKAVKYRLHYKILIHVYQQILLRYM